MTEDAMYEKFADEYAAHATDGPYNALYDRPIVLRLAEPVAGLTVLDAGCGPGLYAAEFIRRGARVIGFDQSPAMVDIARARLGDTVPAR